MDPNLRDQAEAAAHKARAIIPCPSCGEHDVNAMDEEANNLAYAIGTNLFEEGGIAGTREEFMKCIKAVIADSNLECPDCEREH